MSTNILDIILVIFLLLFAYSGFKKGFIIEVAGLAALILGLYFAFFFSDYAARLLDSWFTIDPGYLAAISFIATFIIVVLVVISVGKIVEKFIDIIFLGFFNKLAGAVFGLLKGALILSILIFIINYFDTERTLFKKETCAKSIFYQPVESIAPALYSWVKTTNLHIDFPEKNEPQDQVY
jgi:membrane protein required for colicin V production